MSEYTHSPFALSPDAEPLALVDALEARFADLTALLLAGSLGATNEMPDSYRNDYFEAARHKLEETVELFQLYDKKVRPQWTEPTGVDQEPKEADATPAAPAQVAADPGDVVAKLDEDDRALLRRVIGYVATRA